MGEIYESDYISISDSKKIFDEVMTNYYAENYRICIVSLNTLLYYDLLFKLREVKEKYKVNKINNILEEVDLMYKDEDKYSQLELNFLKLCLTNGLIDKYFYDKALNLRKIRNECAHPGFKDNDIYVPTKSEVIMYIDFLYNELLIKSNINYYNVVDYILDDIAKASEKAISLSNGSLKSRVKRIYGRIDRKSLQKLFSSLFTLSVIKDTEEVRQYREYTYNYLVWLSEYMKRKNFSYDLKVVEKLNIEHLDNSYFNDDNYSIKILIDGIVSLDDIREYNSEIFDLYRDNILKSILLCDIYDKVFDDYDSFIKYLIENKDVTFNQIHRTILSAKKRDVKKYLFVLLKSIIQKVPKFNGFQKADICLDFFIDEAKNLKAKERDELIYLMIDNNQFFNSERKRNNEFIEKIENIYDGNSFSNIKNDIVALYESEEDEDYEPSFLEIR